MKKTFNEFIADYNRFYQCNLRVIRIDTHEIFNVMYDLYDSDDFEIDYDKEIIEVFK